MKKNEEFEKNEVIELQTVEGKFPIEICHRKKSENTKTDK